MRLRSGGPDRGAGVGGIAGKSFGFIPRNSGILGCGVVIADDVTVSGGGIGVAGCGASNDGAGCSELSHVSG